MANPTNIVGIAWYRREDYPRVLEIMADQHLLPRTHDQWEKFAQQAEASAKSRGLAVHRAYIDPEEFITWCAITGRNVDAEARMAWANQSAYRKGRGEH